MLEETCVVEREIGDVFVYYRLTLRMIDYGYICLFIEYVLFVQMLKIMYLISLLNMHLIFLFLIIYYKGQY